MPVVIEVHCSNGDWAEALDEASALVAARTLLEDARETHDPVPADPIKTRWVDAPTITFVVADEPVAGMEDLPARLVRAACEAAGL